MKEKEEKMMKQKKEHQSGWSDSLESLKSNSTAKRTYDLVNHYRPTITQWRANNSRWVIKFVWKSKKEKAVSLWTYGEERRKSEKYIMFGTLSDHSHSSQSEAEDKLIMER